MTNEPMWIINRNGNAADDIKSDYMEAHQAAMALHAALQRVHANSLHGRNYQTNPTGEMDQEIDRERMAQMLQSVCEIAKHTVSGAARAIQQREDL